jgi:hypothetical protein
MRFLMFVTVDPGLAGNADGDVTTWLEETGERRLEGGPLCQVSDATTVWPKDGGGTFVSDGPFAETKEFIAGYDIIECADLDEAIEIVAGHPVAKFGAIELRPVWQ